MNTNKHTDPAIRAHAANDDLMRELRKIGRMTLSDNERHQMIEDAEYRAWLTMHPDSDI